MVPLLNSLTLASLLYVLASGLSLSFGLMRVINLTHGAFYLLGGYFGLTTLKITGNWTLAVFSGGIGIAVLALLEEFFLLRMVRGKAFLETLISLSVAIVISDLIIMIWGGNPKSLDIPDFMSGPVELFGTSYPAYRLFVLGIACMIGLMLWLFLKKTKLGMIIRAGVDNFEMVAAIGINVRRIFTFVFVLSGFLAGIAGVMGGSFLMVAPGEDWRILTFTLIVVIIGGMGSFVGTIIGALITGLVFSYGSIYVPELSLFLMFAPVAIILATRPRGLFGRIT